MLFALSVGDVVLCKWASLWNCPNLNDVTWYYVSGVTNANGLIILQDRLKQLDAKRFYRIGTCPAP